MKFNSNLLKKLVTVYGPSGNEGKIREVIEKEIKDYVDDIFVDDLGNLIARKRKWKKSYGSCPHGSNWTNDYPY